MKKIRIFSSFLKYWVTSNSSHGIHSPFVYELLTKIISSKKSYADYDQIEQLRTSLETNTKKIKVTDLGAGSRKIPYPTRGINEIARNSLKSKKYGQLIYRIVKHFKPKNILELGTSLGVTSSYISKANPESIITTIEGCPEIAKIAKKNFDRMHCHNINLKVGDFKDVLPNFLKTVKSLDFVFFDGNHRKQPTLHYFELCKQHITKNSVFIFDDIHWSEEMNEAWGVIKKDPQVTVTIDLFFLGLVFFRKEQKKEDFIIRF